MKKASVLFFVALLCLFSVTTSAEAAVRLFGTTGYGSGATSTLVELDPATGTVINTIGSIGYMVNGLDYDVTTGKLYGGTRNGGSFNGLIEINMTTGVGTPVGTNCWGGYSHGCAAITNITVNSTGQIYGWSEWGDALVSINKTTGLATDVGVNYIGTYENGLSFNNADVLYLVNGDGAFYTINASTGEPTYAGSFGQTAHHGDFHLTTGFYYGLTWTYGSPRTLLRCDLAAQSCTAVADVGDLHTLAFVTTSLDTTPDQFTFTDQTGVALSTTVTSNTITVSGITSAAPISITGGTYSINGGDYTSVSGTVNNGKAVTVQQTSSGNYSTMTNATLTIGGISDTFSVTTLDDTTPDQFIFNYVTDVKRGVMITSNKIKVSGISVAVPISITGGSYSINGGPYQKTIGKVNNGNTVTVRLQSSRSYCTTKKATLTIGGVSDTFSVTTRGPYGKDCDTPEDIN